MKLLIAIMVSLLASAAYANPFDSFVGNYAIVGAPIIQKSGNVRECVRFGFEYLKGFSVIADTNGYYQTHDLQFKFSGGSIGHGWMGYPAADFNDQTPDSMNSAKTTGDANAAQNESFSAWNHSSDDLIISIQHQGSQYALTVRETSVDESKAPGVCFYQATLTKQ